MKKIMFVALALVLGLASCVKDKKYPGITISDVKYSPIAVTASSQVTVSASISCFNDFTADLVYIISDESNTVEMTADTDGLYTAVIPAQPDATTVTFYVTASNDDATANSNLLEYTVGEIAVDYSVLRLNELNGNDKFIEIFNTGTEEINMNGVYIEKDAEQNWIGDATITIGAGEYLLLYSEDVSVDHPDYPANLIFHSGLSAKKNVRVQLFSPAGESVSDFNLVNIELNGEAYGYPGNQAPASYSVNADGLWYYSDATPNEANVDGANQVLGLEGGTPPTPPTPPTPDYTNLVFNELNGDTKFIEFYNMGDFDLSMEGMYITKDGVEDDIKWTGDATIVVPAHGYVVLYSIDTQADHPELPENMFFNCGLSAKKTVRFALYMPDGTERDVFTRGTTGEWGLTISNVSPQSFARTPDGGEWMLTDPTPGAANPETGDPIPQE